MPRTGAPTTKQACDACRRRKVRCDGTQPCAQCIAASLGCTSLLERRKGGRRGKSAHVLNELRAAQAPDSPCSGSATSGSILANSPVEDRRSSRNHRDRSQQQEDFVRSFGLLPSSLVDDCINFFFTQLGGTVPILHRPTFEKRITERAETCLHTYCLLAAFCAFVVVQTGGGVTCPPLPAASATLPANNNHNTTTATVPTFPSSTSDDGEERQRSDLEYGKALLQEAVSARKHLDLFAEPARQNILVSFFLYGSYIGIGNQRHAYYYLRETTTLYTSGILDAEPDDAEHPSVAGNLFWLLLVSERAHAIRRRRPVTLQVTPESPPLPESATSSSADSTSSSITAFRCLVNLYHPFDETFLGLWNGTHTACSADLLVSMEEHVLSAVPADLDVSDVQLADLRASQQWLRTVIWQLSTTLGFLSSASTQKSLTFQYPLQIARDLAFATWKLPLESIAAHGVGLIEKLSEVTCSLIDVISFLPTTETKSSGFELGPEDYLRHFFWLISTLRGGRRRFLPLLLTKLSQTLPAMVPPIVTHLRLDSIIPSSPSTGAADEQTAAVGPAWHDPLPAEQDSTDTPAAANTRRWYHPLPDAEHGPTSAPRDPASPLLPALTVPSIQPRDRDTLDTSNMGISRIGDKTPEIAKAFLPYSTY